MHGRSRICPKEPEIVTRSQARVLGWFWWSQTAAVKKASSWLRFPPSPRLCMKFQMSLRVVRGLCDHVEGSTWFIRVLWNSTVDTASCPLAQWKYRSTQGLFLLLWKRNWGCCFKLNCSGGGGGAILVNCGQTALFRHASRIDIMFTRTTGFVIIVFIAAAQIQIE
ncbi:hypothetical protein C1H46_010939 [Malus baccata]|uniref:Uncharacterized protein n=1 Tax=Malus baccata TaxID=106549 RepID=A0A540MXG6_MALBA|nr:hypothetical protein C1H46_010939 [Malus baccata]